jgi:hypothetical protein
MRKYIWLVVAAVVAVSLSVGVATATAAKGGNSANAKLCQKGGWMNLQGSDGTQFANQDECVSFGAHGGTIVPKPTCTAGSEDFSGDADLSQPTTFAGGSIDGPYQGQGGIHVEGISWGGFFADGTHLEFNGLSSAPFRLTFTNAVGSVMLDEQADSFDTGVTVTLKAYDSADVLVGSDAAITDSNVNTLSVNSTSNNIKYFTMESSNEGGVGFTNIVWDCA